jgi:hypothetical protein
MAPYDNVQRERIIQAVKNVCPTCAVTFDSSREPKWLRFRIEMGSTTLRKAFSDYRGSEVADWPDEKLHQMMQVLTGGTVRKSA